MSLSPHEAKNLHEAKIDVAVIAYGKALLAGREAERRYANANTQEEADRLIAARDEAAGVVFRTRKALDAVLLEEKETP